MISRTILSIAGILACIAVIATMSCGSNESVSPSAPSTATSMSVAGDDASSDSGGGGGGKSDDRSKDGRSDNFSNDNKSNDGSSSNDGDSSGDGNSFGRASGGFDGINFRAQIQSWSASCPGAVAPPCLILILKNVPVTVLNETEIWDFRSPDRPQITIEEFQSILENADAAGHKVTVKGEGLPLGELDGVSRDLDNDGDGNSDDGVFTAIEVDILS